VGIGGTTCSVDAIGTWVGATSGTGGTSIYAGEFSTGGLAASADWFYIVVLLDSLADAGAGSTLFPYAGVDIASTVFGAALFSSGI
jgi:hypothetical protein